jgi:hypothetical protein
MFKFASVILLLAAACHTALGQEASATPEVGTVYDRFKGETQVSASTVLERYKVPSGFSETYETIELVALFTYKGQNLTAAPSTVRLAFLTQSLNFRFANNRDFRAIVDGERIAFGDMEYKSSDMGMFKREVLWVETPARTFLQLAGGTTVEIRVGSKEIKLQPKDVATLRAVADKFRKLTPQAPAKRGAAKPRVRG